MKCELSAWDDILGFESCLKESDNCPPKPAPRAGQTNNGPTSLVGVDVYNSS